MKQSVQKPRSREHDVVNQNVNKSGWSFLARSGLGVHLETGAGEVLIMEVPKGHKKD